MKKGLSKLLAVIARLVPPTMSACDLEVKTIHKMKRLIIVFFLMLLALPSLSQEQTSAPEIMLYWSDNNS